MLTCDWEFGLLATGDTSKPAKGKSPKVAMDRALPLATHIMSSLLGNTGQRGLEWSVLLEAYTGRSAAPGTGVADTGPRQNLAVRA